MDPLYSPSLHERLTATLEYNAKQADVEYYPEGLRGSANAYAVFVGPSYGGYNGTGAQLAGGENRPLSPSSKRVIGEGLGLNPFPDGRADRQVRWNKLLLACLDTPQGVKHLSALFNLDWGHHADQNTVPGAALELGSDVVAEHIIMAQPRIIVPLTKLVWEHLVPGLIRAGGSVIEDNPVYKHQSLMVKFRSPSGNTFDSVVVRPFNHPSRHFLTDEKINLLNAELLRYKEPERR